MSDFSTEAELEIVVPESELRNVRQQIESEVGTTELGLTDGGTASAQAAQTGGRGGRQRRRARREFRWARERTEYLEDAVVYLEEIEDKVGEGGGGGGVLDDVIGAVVETGGDAAIEAGDTVIDIATDAAATALGNAVADAVSDSSLSVEEPSWTPLAVEDPGTVTVTVDRPDWTPLAVEDPGTVGVDAPEHIPVDDPGELSVEQPTLGVERDPLPVEQPTLGVERDPLPVEEVGPISVEVSVTGDHGGGGGGGSGGSTDDGREGVQIGGEDGVYLGPSGLSVGGEDGFQFGELDNLPGGSQSRSRRSSQTPTGSTQREISVSVDSQSNARVDVSGLDRLRDDILDAFESTVQDTRDDLESEIDDLRSELERLKRDLTR